MSFLSAGLLFGLFLASVPIIIHILNRRRFQVIDWPPMKYLKLTLKKNRRRIRIEQMILLAMRTLAVILLILAVARPVVSQASLSKLMPGRARTSRVLVIDDSLSMGYTTAGRTAFQVAQNAASDLIKAAGVQDSVTVLATSAPDRPVVRDGNLQDSAKLMDIVATLPLTETASNWVGTLEGVRAALSTASFANKEVVLITDLRRAGWTGGATRVADELAEARVPVRIIDVGDRRTENVSLTKFELEETLALPEQPIHVAAAIRNNTGNAIANGQATLSVDGESRPVLLPNLPAGATTEIPLTVSVESAGTHTLSMSLSPDALPADNTRYLTVNVRPTVSVLLVDGAPSAQPFESETDFLALAYSVGARPWNVQRATEVKRIGPGSPDVPDVMVLANVASLTGEQSAAIEKLVQNGMGLMIFVGDQVDVDAYNQRLYREGKGLLPVKLERAMDTPTAGIVVEKDPQSPLAALSKLAPAALAGIRTRQYMAVQGAGAGAALPEGVSVLARWNNAENPAAVIEKSVGKGRVLLFTTTTGKKWTDWPVDRTYVLGVRWAAMGIARSQDLNGTLSAGETLRIPFEAGQAVIDPKVLLPNGKGADVIDNDKVPGGGTVLHYARTDHAGIYTVTWRDEKSKAQEARFAVNPPLSESDLEPIASAQLAELLGNLKPSIQRYDTNGVGLGQPPRELWRPLATILLALMAVETMFAVWVGRER
ncbi:MAG TPA: BatA domain-containing protein [Phycisphaerae bacterium]|nr:BatA domain-containing protein [Phycisphaerae bacterium]